MRSCVCLCRACFSLFLSFSFLLVCCIVDCLKKCFQKSNIVFCSVNHDHFDANKSSTSLERLKPVFEHLVFSRVDFSPPSNSLSPFVLLPTNHEHAPQKSHSACASGTERTTRFPILETNRHDAPRPQGEPPLNPLSSCHPP